VNLEMRQRIDAVVERVKEPESSVSIAQLGLVRKLRYSAENRKLSVFTS
jgi:metal-sulfur cluster biosynthetic enzyme